VSDVLAAVSAEMARQREIHPIRPRHPYHWLAVLTEELLEAHMEISRLAQDQADGPDVTSRLDAARRLRTELIQVSAVAASWVETLPCRATDTLGRQSATTAPPAAAPLPADGPNGATVPQNANTTVPGIVQKEQR